MWHGRLVYEGREGMHATKFLPVATLEVNLTKLVPLMKRSSKHSYVISLCMFHEVATSPL